MSPQLELTMHRLILFDCSTCATGNSRLPCVKMFASVRKHGHTANLPFAVCQLKQHTANGWHTANLLFAMCQAKTHGKRPTHSKGVTLPCAAYGGTRQTFSTRQRVLVCRVPSILRTAKSWHTANLCKKKLIQHSQFFLLYIHIQCIVLLVKIWYISHYFGYI